MEKNEDVGKATNLVVITNIWCAFCGSHRFLYRPYAFDCERCGRQIHHDEHGWNYSYPSSEVFEPSDKKGCVWKLGSTRWWSAIPQYNITTGAHVTPAQIQELENAEQEAEVKLNSIRVKLAELRKYLWSNSR
jgi:hypothetical protein